MIDHQLLHIKLVRMIALANTWPQYLEQSIKKINWDACHNNAGLTNICFDADGKRMLVVLLLQVHGVL
jgi:hypothetical protein